MERRGLGRGLRALIGGGKEEPSASPDRVVPIDRLRPNPYQPRSSFDQAQINELAQSIREYGLLQPLLVRPYPQGNEYQIISGERRWRAAQEAGLTEVPVILRECSDQEMLEMALVENLQREDINPIEAARAYQRLIEEFHLTQEQIALRVGKSRPAVANCLRLLQLPEPIQRSLAEGKITEGHARALLSISDPELQMQVWRKILEQGASVREVEAQARLIRENSETTQKTSSLRRPPQNPPVKDPHLSALEARLRHHLGTRVEILKSRNKGSILIEFYSEGDLERILETIGLVFDPQEMIETN